MSRLRNNPTGEAVIRGREIIPDRPSLHDACDRVIEDQQHEINRLRQALIDLVEAGERATDIDPNVCSDLQPDSQTGEPGGERCGWCPGCSVDRYLGAAREAGADAVTVDGGLVELEDAGKAAVIWRDGRRWCNHSTARMVMAACGQEGHEEEPRFFLVPLDGGDDGE